MTLVPQQKSDRYAAIKKLCCVENPVPSQVICLKTISNEKRLQAVAQKVRFKKKNCIVLFQNYVLYRDFDRS